MQAPGNPILRLSAVELAALIATRKVSAVEAVEAHLRRIEEVNGELRAVVALRADAALAEARAADERTARGEPLPPLHAVPFTVKDWIETDDLPCAAGIDARRDYVPKRDATAVARLRAAGAVLLGKTKPGMDDDTHLRARNPLDLSQSAGGSSGGEAALIAAFGSPLGLGSDSGGSLRWPAHCCGVTTLRPSVGRVPLTGHFPRINPMADPRTVIGPLARTVDDLEVALTVIQGPDGFDASAVPVLLQPSLTVDVSSLRVAWFTEFPGAEPTQAARDAVRKAVTALHNVGAAVSEAMPPRLEEALPLTVKYWRRPESSSWSNWEPGFASRLSADAVEESLFEWDRFKRSMLGFMREFDLVVCPVAADCAPPLGAPVPNETWLFMLPWSLTGYPAAVVPVAADEAGLPIGVQLVAPAWNDQVALAAARVVEASVPLSLREPIK